ncbi:MAG: head completion/stabilization protein [Methylobacter sp.]
MSLNGKPSLTTAAALANDGFWPELLLGDLMDNYRIPSEYADNVIKTGLTLAMIRVNDKLGKVKAKLQTDGYDSLADYTAAHPEPINDSDVFTEHYKNAVFCRAKAGLLKNFQTINRRPQAENQAKEGDDTEDYWLDESQASIAELFRRVLPDEPVFSKHNTFAALI